MKEYLEYWFLGLVAVQFCLCGFASFLIIKKWYSEIKNNNVNE